VEADRLPWAVSGETSASNLLRIVSVLVIAYAFVFAVTPYSTPQSGPHYALRSFQPATSQPSVEVGSVLAAPAPQVHCGAPIVDAWHAKSASSGWFGYAPLTDTPLIAGSACRETSQARLRLCALGVILAIGLVLIARRGDPRPGFGLDPAPT
jgi:hypothetical protein